MMNIANAGLLSLLLFNTIVYSCMVSERKKTEKACKEVITYLRNKSMTEKKENTNDSH